MGSFHQNRAAAAGRWRPVRRAPVPPCGWSCKAYDGPAGLRRRADTPDRWPIARFVALRCGVRSVYKVIELVGTSTESWEKAAMAAVTRAGKTLRDIRIAEIADLDMHIQDGKVQAYRAKVKVSFKFED
jgi:flavin-binding protein dodecin